ncbi:hypothetical protein PTTG_10368 [Puccinia triticina 1-1 BBBD Race 1]|uniref:Uncharacterized protein n=1 Tax=Puccinia triticina (isolate 1-1 / race 1 (BBBD)) TaxID=630390 RepID=A0A0C4FAX5_PUCT1|nr:hypothetical protein PTTG_10368 [Puccinia triticina 1-1 BBBD Race 1]
MTINTAQISAQPEGSSQMSISNAAPGLQSQQVDSHPATQTAARGPLSRAVLRIRGGEGHHCIAECCCCLCICCGKPRPSCAHIVDRFSPCPSRPLLTCLSSLRQYPLNTPRTKPNRYRRATVYRSDRRLLRDVLLVARHGKMLGRSGARVSSSAALMLSPHIRPGPVCLSSS